jgi:hypothetical protein
VKRILVLTSLSIFIMCCCPLTGVIQMAIEVGQNALEELIGPEPTLENLEIDDADIVPTEEEDPFSININPCEGIYEKYRHNPALGEIKADYVGSWHASEMVTARYNERFVLFASGNYLFFPDQYECAYTFKSCVPSPIEDGLWGVEGEVMNFAKGGDMEDLISRPITPIIPSSLDESPYPFKTTIDGLTFWLMSKSTDYWDPETGDYCDW